MLNNSWGMKLTGIARGVGGGCVGMVMSRAVAGAGRTVMSLIFSFVRFSHNKNFLQYEGVCASFCRSELDFLPSYASIGRSQGALLACCAGWEMPLAERVVSPADCMVGRADSSRLVFPLPHVCFAN